MKQNAATWSADKKAAAESATAQHTSRTPAAWQPFPARHWIVGCVVAGGLLGIGCRPTHNDHLPTLFACAPEDPLQNYYPDQDGDGFGSGEPLQGCGDVEGYSRYTGDCDDNNAAISPGAIEACNGPDVNCNGTVGTTSMTVYPDLDGDGYGDASAEAKTSCEVPERWSTNNLDCLDSDASAFPRWVDIAAAPDGDGTDQHPFATIQAALDVPNACGSIRIRPGTYDERLELKDRSGLTLSSTGGREATILTSTDSQRPLTIEGGNNLTFRGLTLSSSGSVGGPGGCLLATDVDGLVLDSLILQNGKIASGSSFGGGFALENVQNLQLSQSIIQNNSAVEGGGGILLSSYGDITDCTFSDNVSDSSGGGLQLGLYSDASSGNTSQVDVYDSSFVSNRTGSWGGAAAAVVGNTLNVERSSFESNYAGAVYAGALMNPSRVYQCFFYQNRVDALTYPLGDGGAIYAIDSADIYNSIFLANDAVFGGAINLAPAVGGQVFNIINNTFVENDALDNGDAINIYGTGDYVMTLVMVNNISYNKGSLNGGDDNGVYNWDLNFSLEWTINDNNIFTEGGDSFDGAANIEDADQKYGNLAIDPLFTQYTPGNYTSYNLTLQAGSPCKATGDTSYGTNPGQTVTDMGAYGGPGALPSP